MNYLKDFIKNFEDTNYVHWFCRLNNTMQNLFTYENVPESLNVMMLENYLHLSGVCAIINDDKYGIIAVLGNYGTDVDVYGIGTHFVGANCKKSYDIDIKSDNIVMCHNNITMTNDYYLVDKYSHILTEIDKSLNTNIYYSRVYNVPCISDSKVEKQVAQLMKYISKGEYGKYISKDVNLNDMLDKNNIDMINLTNGSESVHMDTLIRLKDSVLKNFLREIGINVNTMDKSAQVNNKELQAFETYSNLNLFDYYQERKKFIDSVNAKFGTDIKIKLNEMLFNQVTKSNQEVKTDNTNNESNQEVNNNESENMDITE